MTKKLSPDSFARAAAFLGQAGPLDRALFAFHFAQAPSAAVRAALQPLQNEDGGFAGLEPDFGITRSSVLCTVAALHFLHETGAKPGDGLVRSALAYLGRTFDRALDAWPIVPPHDNSQPHAPWWHYAENFAEIWGRFQDNPRPDALACLYLFPAAETDALREHVTRAVLARLAAAEEQIEMHSLLSYARLAETAGLPAELQIALGRRLPGWIERTVERDPAKWQGYGLRPLDVVPMADSPFRALLAPAVEAQLDFLIESQATDGSWTPHWSWGDFFPEAWPKAQRQWQAILTLRALRTLRSYGRL